LKEERESEVLETKERPTIRSDLFFIFSPQTLP
jgi:hypothetical protein